MRYGGDEFLLVMPGISLEAFVEKLHRIQDLICNMSVGRISATEIVSQHRRYADERGDSQEGDVPGGRIYVSGEDLQEHDCD